MTKRTKRLNSLLREVLSDVIQKKVRNPDIAPFTTVSRVDITEDLYYAKVFISVFTTDKDKELLVREQTLKALNSAAGFIGLHASEKVVMRQFPTLTFFLDTSVDKQMNVEALLKKIHEEKENRKPHA